MAGSRYRHSAPDRWIPRTPRLVLADGPLLLSALRKPSLIGVVAAAKVTVAAALLSVPLHPAVLGTAALAAVTVYLHNDATDIAEDAVNRGPTTRWVATHTGTVRAIAGLTYLCALGLAAVGGIAGVAITLVPAVAAVVYSEPWIPGHGVDRLKEVTVLNTVLVAGAWALPITVLPLTVSSIEIGGSVVVVGVFLFLRTCIGVEVMNVRDVAGDRAAGVGTLPVRWGITTTRHALWCLDVLTGLVLLVAVLTGILAPIFGVVIAPVLVYSSYVTGLVDSGYDPTFVGHAKDAEYLLMALGVLAIPGATVV